MISPLPEPMATRAPNVADVSSFGGWSNDPTSPDYANPAWQEMAPRWQTVQDIRGGTDVVRAKAGSYLPKFEAEEQADWNARVQMTFVDDHYARTVVDHTGLIFAQPLKLGDDVPEQIVELTEDIDGEGNHLDVFAQTVLDSALHLGHGVILTDYPPPEGLDHGHELAGVARPYAVLYKASDVRSWQTAVVGGRLVIVQIMLREHGTKQTGEFGSQGVEHFREFRQAVNVDPATGRATSLGAITWRLWERTKGEASAPSTLVPVGVGGTLTAPCPKQIPVRVVYGGEKLGTLHTKPALWGLAMKNIEETQVASDYAAVMHKCNVPTPIFIGRPKSQKPGEQDKVKMGQGIDIPINGDAKFLEPTGTALSATRTRLEDIRLAMRRQGATTADADGQTLTATEASLLAKQRNAKLLRAARSLQDAIEGMFEDMAAFLGLPDGGSVAVSQDFTGVQLDPGYLTVLGTAFKNGALELQPFLHALQTGKLPDDFNAEDAAFRAIAAAAAAADQAKADQAKAGGPPAPPVGGDPGQNEPPA
jgi:hypothetical protein